MYEFDLLRLSNRCSIFARPFDGSRGLIKYAVMDAKLLVLNVQEKGFLCAGDRLWNNSGGGGGSTSSTVISLQPNVVNFSLV